MFYQPSCCYVVCRLRKLELGSCAITDDGLAKLVRTCHDLTALNIGQCSRVTDVGLSLIADNLQNLESIDLYGCTKITTVGLQQIMKLPKLSTLNLGLWHKWWSLLCNTYFTGLEVNVIQQILCCTLFISDSSNHTTSVMDSWTVKWCMMITLNCLLRYC